MTLRQSKGKPTGRLKRPNCMRRMPKGLSSKRGIGRRSWRRELRRSGSLSKRKKTFKIDSRKKRRSYTGSSSRSRTCRRRSKSWPTQLRRWRQAWSLKSSKSRIWRRGFWTWRKSLKSRVKPSWACTVIGRSERPESRKWGERSSEKKEEQRLINRP